jgi:hypothetical protein
MWGHSPPISGKIRPVVFAATTRTSAFLTIKSRTIEFYQKPVTASLQSVAALCVPYAGTFSPHFGQNPPSGFCGHHKNKRIFDNKI